MDVINRGMKRLLVLEPPKKVPPVPLFVLLPREVVTAAPLIESFYGNFPARGPPFPSALSLTCAFSNSRLVHKIPNSLKFKTPSGGDASLQKIRTCKNSKVPFSCPVCPEKFRIKSKLVRHIRLHHGSGIKCRLCLRTFPSVSACTTHLTMKHSKQGYPCSDCDFKTFQASEFETHWQEHRGHMPEARDAGKSEEKARTKNSEEDRKKFFCDLCPTEYTRKSQLLRHKNEMHGVDIACEICSQVFNSMVSLRSHVFTKHTGKDNICEICGYSTKKMYDFKRHQVKHNNEYTVTCTVCNKGFYSAYEFNEHKNVHTAERPYQCEVCGVDYSRRSSLILHKNRKHPEIYDSSKRCPVCNRVCITKDTMEAHVKTHFEGRKRYYCDICGKGLLTAMILKIHRRSHTGEKPFDCSHCGRAFSCKKNLAVHIRLHTGERPYSCKVCWKAYTKSSALKTHEKTHSGRYIIESKIEIKEEPLYQDSDEEERSRNCPTGAQVKEENLHCQQKAPCDFCGELYLKNQLARHKKRHYEESKNHKCEHCRLSFTMMTKLAVHRKTAHGLEMICEKCDKQFQNVYSFSSHLRKHKKEKSFVCDVCGFATTEKGTLCSHKLVKHQIGKFPFHCSTCGKGFLSNYLLSDHVNRHTGATPHQCHKCGSAYSSIRSLERHCYKFHPELYKDKFFKCKTCTRVYKSQKNLEAHQAEKHPNGRRNFCDICGKDFSFRESLIRHRRIHTGEKPKECSVCKRRFACATYLQSHMRTHTGEKPYQCRFCWKKFSQRSSMVTHEKTHLKGLKSSGLEIAPLASEPQNAP